jgi:hypothetical protein
MVHTILTFVTTSFMDPGWLGYFNGTPTSRVSTLPFAPVPAVFRMKIAFAPLAPADFLLLGSLIQLSHCRAGIAIPLCRNGKKIEY